MSQNEYLRKIAEGVVGFSGDMKIFTDEIRENLDKVLTRHYQANHTPYAVMSFEDEYRYWEETLACSINKIIFPTNNDEEYLSRVSLLRTVSYVIIRGNLKSGNTIRFDETKVGQLYINGERYTGNYTFNGETPDIYERITVFIVQTPYNITTREWGELIVDVADFPIENAEIFANVGTTTRLQPVIEELLEDETVESFYIKGDWTWNTSNRVYIKTLKTLDNFIATAENLFTAPLLLNYILPNSLTIPANQRPYSMRNLDIRNAGSIPAYCFHDSLIEGELYLTNTGSTGSECFYGCVLLTAVYIGEGITNIGNAAFQRCTSLRKIVIGDNVTSIGQSAFSDCHNIKELHLGKSVTSTNTNTFYSTSVVLNHFTVSKGYHCATTILHPLGFNQLNVIESFLEVVKNCANVGEDGRTATTMTFKVASSVRTAITNAYNAGDEKAIELYDLMSEKSITITT